MQTDFTAEIFTALGVTPETQPNRIILERGDFHTDFNYEAISLLDGTIESDGLAVRLWGILVDKGLQPTDYRWTKFLDYGYGVSFAQLVHDALCEALGIGEGE